MSTTIDGFPECNWCLGPIKPGEATARFRGFLMHATCAENCAEEQQGHDG